MVPANSNPQWRSLVTGQKQFEFKSLGLKILMGRIQLAIKYNPSEDTISKGITEVYEYFVKNEKSSEADLKQIFQ